jgi:hypothetical protein
MRRPGYREAITWLALNDDCYLVNDGLDAVLSVSASLVADLFGQTDAKVITDLRRVLENTKHPALKRT